MDNYRRWINNKKRGEKGEETSDPISDICRRGPACPCILAHFTAARRVMDAYFFVVKGGSNSAAHCHFYFLSALSDSGKIARGGLAKDC
jgi:hypothetical protein